MPEQNNLNRVIVSAAPVDAVTAIRMTPLQSIRALLFRLGVESEEGLPKEVYATALYDALCEDRQQLLAILPGDMIHFLIQIWEKDSLEMEERYWSYVRYLSMLGFVYSQRGNALFASKDMIFYVEDMKEEFYFLFKSRGSQALTAAYDEWDRILTGLMYYYGLIELQELHRIFVRVLGEQVPFSDLESFMLKRCTFWDAGSFLRSGDGQIQYFQHINADDAGKLLYERDSYDLPWYVPDKDRCLKLCAAGGLDNSWHGFTNLVKLLGEELQMDYYQTSVMVRSIIRLIQNGCDLKSLYTKLDGIPFTDERQRMKASEAFDDLYQDVPVFSLKGYNRAGYDALTNEKQLKKRKKRFTTIEGGKQGG